MKLLNRDKQDIVYELYYGTSEIMDGTMHTGEYIETYQPSVTTRGVVAPNTGKAVVDIFGMGCDYGRVIYLDGDEPIAETTLITLGSDKYRVERVCKYPNVTVVGISLLQ